MKIRNLWKRVNPLFLFLHFLGMSLWATPPENPFDFEARVAKASAQYEALVAQNAWNDANGLSENNWYIFGNYDYIDVRGKSYLEKSEVIHIEVIEKLNTQLATLKEDEGVDFYIYLAGFRVPTSGGVITVEDIKNVEYDGQDYTHLFNELNQKTQITKEDISLYETAVSKAIFDQYSDENLFLSYSIYLGTDEIKKVDPTIEDLGLNLQVYYLFYPLKTYNGEEVNYDNFYKLEDFYSRKTSQEEIERTYGSYTREEGSLFAHIDIAYHVMELLDAGEVIVSGENFVVGEDYLNDALLLAAHDQTATARENRWQDAIENTLEELKEIDKRRRSNENFGQVYLSANRFFEDSDKNNKNINRLRDKLILLESQGNRKLFWVVADIPFTLPIGEAERLIQDVWEAAKNDPSITLTDRDVLIVTFRHVFIGNNQESYPFVFSTTYCGADDILQAQAENIRTKFKQSFLKGPISIQKVTHFLQAAYTEIPKPYKLYLYSLNNQGDIRHVITEQEEVPGYPTIYDFTFYLQKPPDRSNPNPSTDAKWYLAGSGQTSSTIYSSFTDYRSPLIEKYIPEYSLQHIKATVYRLYGRKYSEAEEEGQLAPIPTYPDYKYYKDDYIVTPDEALQKALETQSLLVSFSGLFPVAITESAFLVTAYTFDGKLNKAGIEASFAAIDAFLTLAPAVKLGFILASIVDLRSLGKLQKADELLAITNQAGKKVVEKGTDDVLRIVDEDILIKIGDDVNIQAKFVADVLSEGGTEFLEGVAKNPDLVDSWKVLSDGGVDDLIKRNPEALEIIDRYKNTVDSDLGKLTDKFKNAANKEDAFSEVITEVRRKARQSPGTSSGNGFEITGQWMRGTDGNLGLFPKSVADKMKGKQFNNFDEFRTEFWKTVADDPDLSSQFIPSNVTRMRNGSAPRVAETQQLGGRLSFEIHHKTPIHDGGGVYDIDNMVIVTPRYHKEILDPAYHFNK